MDARVHESEMLALQQDGVVVLKNKIDSNHLSKLAAEVKRLTEFIKSKISTMPRPLKNYTDIAERQLGRLDFRCGFTATIFKTVEPDIVNFIKKVSPRIDFRYYWGAIPSFPGAGPTNMHRDVYPVLNRMRGMNLCEYDLKLPPYYFTVLIPLMKITDENGPTEFIKGSHRKAVVTVHEEEVYAPLLNPGDIVIFDGRTMHRGAANLSKKERSVAYITFIAKWYHDQTFVINNYLFPELCIKGRY